MSNVHPDPLPAWTLRQSPDGIDAILVLTVEGEDHIYSFSRIDELFDTGAVCMEAAITLKSALAVGSIEPFVQKVPLENVDQIDLREIGYKGIGDLDEEFREIFGISDDTGDSDE